MYEPELDLTIFTPSFLQASIVLLTSSDSNTFVTVEIFWQIEPIRKDLIDKDLSESTSMILLKGFIFSLTFTENDLAFINYKLKSWPKYWETALEFFNISRDVPSAIIVPSEIT